MDLAGAQHEIHIVKRDHAAEGFRYPIHAKAWRDLLQGGFSLSVHAVRVAIV
ncbi:hypothetical protein FJ970_19505 [Mesorhizobium sp. B2-1-8]|uniref:hypothetical protein n=1 Tax=Mesorhizobium sp. B2-1-8 TaxID=2589967 RepID=UPI001D109B53|nr:hypothetical protein [Mesorhizobium sp. B2-1-8]UCI22608.1 hypothetical protein FJ970_19505 [Mesorhizobium sp. B2-1-8]